MGFLSIESSPLCRSPLTSCSSTVTCLPIRLSEREILPKQFHEQVLRCASDTGLNVFATINNRFIIDGLPAREHGMLDELAGATFLIEVKSGFLPEAAKGSRSTFAEAVERKFVKNEKGKPKGVGQLAATLESIRGGSGLLHDQPIYSILVGEDPVLASFAMNTYLNDIFLKATPHRRTDDRLAVMLIDELEHILPYLSHGDIDWKELLDGRIVLGKMSPEHVASTFNTTAVRRGVKVREETFLSKQGEELTAMLDRAFEGLSD